MIPISEEFPLGRLMERFKARQDVHDVFGVILYTEADPYIIKVLRDDDFWKALDAASGPRWPIFSIRPKPGRHTLEIPAGRDGALGFLIPIHRWHEPSENRQLLRTFGIEDTSQLPLLLVFAQHSRKGVLQTAIKISGDDVDTCYASLRTAIDLTANAVKNVHEENIKSTFEVYNLMEGALQQQIWFRRIKKSIAFAEWLKSVGSFFGGKQ